MSEVSRMKRISLRCRGKELATSAEIEAILLGNARKGREKENPEKEEAKARARTEQRKEKEKTENRRVKEKAKTLKENGEVQAGPILISGSSGRRHRTAEC